MDLVNVIQVPRIVSGFAGKVAPLNPRANGANTTLTCLFLRERGAERRGDDDVGQVGKLLRLGHTLIRHCLLILKVVIGDILIRRGRADGHRFLGENKAESEVATDIVAPVLPLLRLDIHINETLPPILGQFLLDVLQADLPVKGVLLNPDPVRRHIGIVIGN